MSAISLLSPGPNVPDIINVVVEIPKGSQNKYEYDHDTHMLKLDRVLFSPLHYPGDYGFVPQTLGEDGDPLDALVLMTFPTYPGTLIEARPIGILDMIDSGESDGKLLCVPTKDIRFENQHHITDVHQPILDEIAHFFEVYKHLEGKKVEIKGWKDRDAAHSVILGAIKRFEK